MSRVSAEIRHEGSGQLRHSEAARIEVEQKLAEQVAKTEAIKKKIYWRCDSQAGREALALSILIWVSQVTVAVFGVLKISESSKLGWIMVVVAGLSGIVRLTGARWDIKPLKVYPAFKEWRRAQLQKTEYAALSIED